MPKRLPIWLGLTWADQESTVTHKTCSKWIQFLAMTQQKKVLCLHLNPESLKLYYLCHRKFGSIYFKQTCSSRGGFHKLVCTLCQNSLCPMPNFWETFYWLKRSVQGTKDWRRAQFMKSKSFSHSVHLEWPWSGTRPNASKSKPLCQWIKHLCNAI